MAGCSNETCMSPMNHSTSSIALALSISLLLAACGGEDNGENGGGGGAGGSGGAGPLSCTSGKTWNPGWDEGAQMNPGKACNSCHKKSGEDEAPIYDIAGTVYPTEHEPDYCYGVDGASPGFQDVLVQITDANGAVYSLRPGKTGNFWLRKAGFAAPYTAKVVSSVGERSMSTAQTVGDCNLCHTARGGGNGSAAPGRIVIPY